MPALGAGARRWRLPRVWLAGEGGLPRAGAVWPEEGAQILLDTFSGRSISFVPFFP